MKLSEFLGLDGEHTFSLEEAQSLNQDLASVSAQDIPVIHRARVEDYLISALNINSVECEVKPALELLLSELQTCAY